KARFSTGSVERGCPVSPRNSASLDLEKLLEVLVRCEEGWAEGGLAGNDSAPGKLSREAPSQPCVRPFEKEDREEMFSGRFRSARRAFQPVRSNGDARSHRATAHPWTSKSFLKFLSGAKKAGPREDWRETIRRRENFPGKRPPSPASVRLKRRTGKRCFPAASVHGEGTPSPIPSLPPFSPGQDDAVPPFPARAIGDIPSYPSKVAAAPDPNRGRRGAPPFPAPTPVPGIPARWPMRPTRG